MVCVAMRYLSAKMNVRRALGSQLVAFITGYSLSYHMKGVAEVPEKNDRGGFVACRQARTAFILYI